MRVLVFTTVYPNAARPNFGIFVHERIRRLASLCSVKVLAPLPSPLFLRRRRYSLPKLEVFQGLNIYHTPFYYIPGVLKFLDGWFLYASSVRTVEKIRKDFPFDLIDAHFAYPDGFAAVLLGRHFSVPVTITLRGTINRLIHYPFRRQAVRWALSRADRVFSVSEYLANLARSVGIPGQKFVVVPNGVDTQTFSRKDQTHCREVLGIGLNRKVLVSVGALAERKGHHRVLDVLPDLVKRFSDLLYVIVGGPSVEGNLKPSMEKFVRHWGLEKHVRFAGEVPHESVALYLSASDVFVLPTRFEGWANVFLEAMACGLPVVTTDVCGNGEIVKEGTGILVPFGDRTALRQAIADALERPWNRTAIIDYAKSFTWERAARRVYEEFRLILSSSGVPTT